MSALDTLRAATPARETVTLCMDAALRSEWQATLARYEGAQEGPETGSLEKTTVMALAEELDAIRDRMRASEVTFHFERVGPWQSVALQAGHPPRKDNAIDRLRGFNIETYYPALIRAACVAVSKHGDDPEPIPAEVWDGLLGTPATDDEPAVVGTLNTQQTNDLIAAAQYVNDGKTLVPPSARSLLESQDSGASLELPDPGTSPRSGSGAGSRPTSPKSSATKKGRSKARSSGT